MATKKEPNGNSSRVTYTFVISLSQHLELLSIMALWTKPQTNNPKSWL